MAGRRRRTRGTIDQLPSGNFRVRVYAGTDPLTGKPRYLQETHPSETAAEKARTRLQNQVDEKRHPRSNVTITQVLRNWMDVADHADSTRERYEDLIRLYIEPAFGSMTASKLDAETLERFYARLLRCSDLSCSGRRRKGHTCTPLAPNTVRKVHFILRSALDRAVRWKYLSVNEAEIAEPPQFETSEPDPPSAEEAASLLNEASRDPQWHLLLWMAMITGSRRGELCSLKWSHLDLDRRIAWMQKSRSDPKEGGKDKSTKTGRSRRVALDEYTVELLTAHRNWMRGNCEQLGIPMAADAYVFSNEPNGSVPLRPASVTQRYRRLATSLGLRSTRLHALRHYSATELIASGVDLRTVAERLGHGNGATTIRIYSAWVAEADERAAGVISSIVPRPDPTKRKPRGLYEEIAAKLRADIQNGTLAPGDELPTVAELAVTHDVAVGTAQRAMALLRTEGLIEVSRGRRASVKTQQP
ncbi:site-specific integrase [Saccharopolyspora rosea]